VSTPRGPRELERERAVFLGALEIKPDQREAYLQEACGGDAPLRRRAEALLAAYGDESDTLDDAAALSEFELPVGTLIGRYRLLNQIGEGGFGVVYEAEQTRPVSRRVALKIIKPGMDSRRVIARFEAERQALALMDHPGIAHVYDAGTTETGRPYFVMEYIGGCPITDYCDARRLAIRDRLALVREVCLAIQHAHQRGIIHRDIKPSNVLVTEVDGRAVPKIIDFGVAKSLSVRLTERTLFTETGSVIGTPEYMSPEQADLGGVDVDTRTDVYSLGVLLYELLAGTPPFEPARFRSASLREIQRILREEPAPRPSARLSTLLAEHQQSRVAAIAERRRSTLEELRQQLRRELEWIPLKAVRKDRNERYPTALGLAEDIQRYLEHRPLLAGPPSTIYIVRKFVRKNWVGVGVAAAFGLLIVLGLVGTGLGFARAERERRLAESRAEELEAALSFQIAQLKGLEPSSLGGGIREHLVAFVRESMLKAGVTPDVIETRMALLEDELEPVSFTTLAMHTLDEHIYTRSLEAAQTEFADRPLLRARVLQALADVLRTRGLLDEAVAPQGEALAIRTDMLGVEAPETLESCLASGRLLLARTDYESAIETFRDVGDTGERVLGEGHPTTIGAWTGLADTHWVFRRFDQVGEIRARVVDALEATAGPDDPATLEAVSQLAAARWQQLRHLEAERLFRVCAERSARVLGDADWRTIKTRVQLAQLLTHMDRHDDAIALVDRAMADMDQHGGSTSRNRSGWPSAGSPRRTTTCATSSSPTCTTG
jgi:serine/threonine protein kinase